MIKVGTLKRLLEMLPNEAEVTAYEGEGIGLNIREKGGRSGWIETGPWNSWDHEEVDVEAKESEHDLKEFQ